MANIRVIFDKARQAVIEESGVVDFMEPTTAAGIGANWAWLVLHHAECHATGNSNTRRTDWTNFYRATQVFDAENGEATCA